MRCDPRAEDVVRFVLIDFPRTCLSAILERMMALGRIEPVDVDAFCELYVNSAYGASMRSYSQHPVDSELWLESRRMLFSVLQPK